MTSSELQTLFENHYSELCTFASKIVPRNEVHDIVMDTFISVFEHPSAQANHSHVRNYLYLSVRNKCVDIMRRRRFVAENFIIEDEQLVAHNPSIEVGAENKETVIEIVKIISLLHPKQKMVIELSFIGEATREEIAKIMDLSPNTVRNHKARAMEIIKSKLNSLE